MSEDQTSKHLQSSYCSSVNPKTTSHRSHHSFAQHHHFRCALKDDNMSDTVGKLPSLETETLERVRQVAWIWQEHRHTRCFPVGGFSGDEDDLLRRDCQEIDDLIRKNSHRTTIVTEGLKCFGGISLLKSIFLDHQFDIAKDFLPPVRYCQRFPATPDAGEP